MKSSKELQTVYNLNISFDSILLPIRYYSNELNSSLYNETITTLLGVNFKKVNKHTLPFTQIKEYLKVCLVEHLITQTRYQDSVTIVDSCDTSNLNKHPKQLTQNNSSSHNSSNINNNKNNNRNSHIESQLDSLEVYIDNFEAEFLTQPYCCINCGLRFMDLDELNKHPCRILNLMTHFCSCGDTFNDHALFIKHIKPNKVNYYGKNLIFPKCKWISFHYLFLWLKLTFQNKQELSFECDICEIKFTNFISWLAHYYDCLNNDYLTCFICADNISKTCDESYSYIRSIFLPMIKNNHFEMSLKCFSQFFVNVKLNSSRIETVMSSIGFDNVFYFELNQLLQKKLNFNEIKLHEEKVYQYRILQLVEFFLNYPDVCYSCYSRINESNKELNVSLNGRKRHKCKRLMKEQHICLCSARFSSHENYVFHQLYRCQFLVFIHICVLMVINRATIIYSLCKSIYVPMHNLPFLREHWKQCKQCHLEWIKNCSFCSSKFKEQFEMDSKNYDIYFKRLLEAKDLVLNCENKLESDTKTKNEYNETNLVCLKSGPPFSLLPVNKNHMDAFD